MSAAEISFTAEITASHDDSAAAYTAAVVQKGGETAVTVTAPESISGVTFRSAVSGRSVAFEGVTMVLSPPREGEFPPADAPALLVRGADLADGTPILDVKPYLPYADSRPEAAGGFTDAVGFPLLRCVIPEDLLSRVPEDRREALAGVLEQDPRPSYQDDPERVYGFVFAGLEVRFTVSGGVLTVREIR